MLIRSLVKRILERLSERSKAFKVVSIGTVSLRSDFGSVDEIMAEVDRLMYEAKESGKSVSRH